jgi:hypothetical protein
MDESDDLPVPVPSGPPPGGNLPAYVEPAEGLSAGAMGRLSHDYIHTNKRVEDIALSLGASTRDVRSAIKRYGLDKRKAEIIQQVQQEELAAYGKFLLDNRVPTAQRHLEISNQLNEAVGKILNAAADKTPEELAAVVKPLRDVASLYRSLSETLSASSGVGARAVSLSGLTAEQAGGLQLAQAAGKRPLVSLSFNVQQAPRQQETMDAEVIDVQPETL